MVSQGKQQAFLNVTFTFSVNKLILLKECESITFFTPFSIIFSWASSLETFLFCDIYLKRFSWSSIPNITFRKTFWVPRKCSNRQGFGVKVAVGVVVLPDSALFLGFGVGVFLARKYFSLTPNPAGHKDCRLKSKRNCLEMFGTILVQYWAIFREHLPYTDAWK